MEKKDLRNFIRMQKKMFSQQQLDELSEQIIDRLMASPKVKAAKTVLMYYSLDDEVNTHNTEMELRRYTGPQDLQGGFFNIMEPVGERFDRYEEIDLAVVPGMAFDSQNNRLGRGKGYYDRMLPRLVNAYKIGVCFDFQRLPGVPADEHDCKVDEVI